MKTSAMLFLTDIMPEKRKLFGKIVKNDVFGKLPREKVFEALKKAGVDGIELLLPSYTKITFEDIKDIKEVLEKQHMPVLSVHQALRFFTTTRIAEITQLFEIASLLKAKIIVLHMSTVGKQVFDTEYIRTLHDLQEKYGIKIGFENGEKYIGSLRNKYGWDQKDFPDLMKRVNLNMTLDTTHLATAGGDILTFFKKNKDNIVNIHISDYKSHFLNSSLRPLRYKHLPFGKGQLPLKEFIKMLHSEKYQGLVTMEMHTDLDGMCEGARAIKMEEN